MFLNMSAITVPTTVSIKAHLQQMCCKAHLHGTIFSSKHALEKYYMYVKENQNLMLIFNMN